MHTFSWGPRGSERKEWRRYLAQALLCERVPAVEFAPCGKCACCTQVRANTHPDLLQVRRPDDRNELPIAVIQDLVGQLSLCPSQGKSKVGIVDDADDLNEESANSFLKTLEEPPPRSVLILIATSIDTQLPTIQSRCQLVRFRELSPTTVASLLLELNVVSIQHEAESLARRSEGSIGRAIEMAQPASREIEKELIRGFSTRPFHAPAMAELVLQFIEDAGKDSASKRTRGARSFGSFHIFLGRGSDRASVGKKMPRLGNGPDCSEWRRSPT